MRTERWKSIEGHPDYYISSSGRIRNKHGRILKTFLISGGLSVAVCENNEKTTLRIAREVGRAFCRRFREGLVPRYVDGDRTNCTTGNIRWVLRSKITGVPYSVNPRK
jgi:NUMOD4 motif